MGEKVRYGQRLRLPPNNTTRNNPNDLEYQIPNTPGAKGGRPALGAGQCYHITTKANNHTLLSHSAFLEEGLGLLSVVWFIIRKAG